MKAEIFVRLKNSVLDPQGKAIQNSLKTLGYNAIASVRQGKVFDVELNVESSKEAEKILQEVSEKLLANTVIEDFQYKIQSEKTK